MIINLLRKNANSVLLFDFMVDLCDVCLEYASRREYDSQSDEKKQKKMVEISQKKYEGIGPTTKDGVPIVLRSVSSVLIVNKTKLINYFNKTDLICV